MSRTTKNFLGKKKNQIKATCKHYKYSLAVFIVCWYFCCFSFLLFGFLFIISCNCSTITLLNIYFCVFSFKKYLRLSIIWVENVNIFSFCWKTWKRLDIYSVLLDFGVVQMHILNFQVDFLTTFSWNAGKLALNCAPRNLRLLSVKNIDKSF